MVEDNIVRNKIWKREIYCKNLIWENCKYSYVFIYGVYYVVYKIDVIFIHKIWNKHTFQTYSSRMVSYDY